MSRERTAGAKARKVRTSRFPMRTFGLTLGVLLLMSGVHVGLILGVNAWNLHEGLQTAVMIAYWVAVSIGFTFWIRRQMKRTYEEPLKRMAEATAQVAAGDFSVYVPPIHTADKLDYLDVMIMDFNKMVEELGSIETLKTDFFSNVSHEIKTPIAVIQNSAQMLMQEGVSETERQEYVLTIIQSSRKLTALITNILKLNKLEKQAIQPVMEPYDVCEQLVECALQFENIWEEKEIEFDADLEDEAMICADAGLMELVWTNLLSNALKFTEKGGVVGIRECTDADAVVVSVYDSGCGMDADTMAHIFDKFYQGDTSHHAEGNGLGLALVLRIVQLMGGRIEAKSAPGEGTTFTVRLPEESVRRRLDGERKKA